MAKIGAFAIVLDDDGRVLLCLRHDRDLWNLPGGGAELAELPTDAAVRETLEETGVAIAIVRLVGVYVKPGEDDLVFTFLARPTGGAPTPSSESRESRWFAPADLPSGLFLTHLERICDALDDPPAPVFRVQSNLNDEALRRRLPA